MDYNAVIPEFMVSNIEQSRSFYCDLLGLRLNTSDQKKIFSSFLLRIAS